MRFSGTIITCTLFWKYIQFKSEPAARNDAWWLPIIRRIPCVSKLLERLTNSLCLSLEPPTMDQNTLLVFMDDTEVILEEDLSPTFSNGRGYDFKHISYHHIQIETVNSITEHRLLSISKTAGITIHLRLYFKTSVSPDKIRKQRTIQPNEIKHFLAFEISFYGPVRYGIAAAAAATRKLTLMKSEVAMLGSRRLEEKIETLRFKRLSVRLSPVHYPISESTTVKTHIFHDETLPSIFRRLSWSPNGSFLLIPSDETSKQPESKQGEEKEKPLPSEETKQVMHKTDEVVTETRHEGKKQSLQSKVNTPASNKPERKRITLMAIDP
ncbi:hypothetical protein YC2023_073027 [Brassica napus]